MQNCFYLDLPVSCERQWYVHCNWNKLDIYDANNHIIFFNEKNSADSMVSGSCMLIRWSCAQLVDYMYLGTMRFIVVWVSASMQISLSLFHLRMYSQKCLIIKSTANKQTNIQTNEDSHYNS